MKFLFTFFTLATLSLSAFADQAKDNCTFRYLTKYKAFSQLREVKSADGHIYVQMDLQLDMPECKENPFLCQVRDFTVLIKNQDGSIAPLSVEFNEFKQTVDGSVVTLTGKPVNEKVKVKVTLDSNNQIRNVKASQKIYNSYFDVITPKPSNHFECEF